MKWHDNYESLHIADHEFTRVGDRAMAIIETKSSATIVGVMNFQPHYPFHSPSETFFTHDIHVDLEKTNESVALRLPSSVKERLSSYTEEKKSADQTAIQEVLTQSHGEFDYHQCWTLPLVEKYKEQHKVVSEFASPRTPPNGPTYYHTGVDFRAGEKTAVHVAANGRVVLTDMFPISGNMMVVDHGGGIFTEYKHLSEFQAQVGDRVSRGDVIGLSGATGRVEAPHLHWEMSWQGIPGDPNRFLRALERICDRE